MKQSMKPYFSCHNHTKYSNIRLIDSINHPEDLIDKAIELGLSGLAILGIIGSADSRQTVSEGQVPSDDGLLDGFFASCDLQREAAMVETT